MNMKIKNDGNGSGSQSRKLTNCWELLNLFKLVIWLPWSKFTKKILAAVKTQKSWLKPPIRLLQLLVFTKISHIIYTQKNALIKFLTEQGRIIVSRIELHKAFEKLPIKNIINIFCHFSFSICWHNSHFFTWFGP